MTCEQNLGLTVDHRERTVFFEGRAVWVRNYPISIDPKTFLAARGTARGPRARRSASSSGGRST